MKHKTLKSALIEAIASEERFIQNFVQIPANIRTRKRVLKDARNKLAAMYDLCAVLNINISVELDELLSQPGEATIKFERTSGSIMESVDALLNQITKRTE